MPTYIPEVEIISAIPTGTALTTSASIIHGSPIVTGISSTAGLVVGQEINSRFPSNTYILSIDSPTQVTMSANASASTGTYTVTFAAFVFPTSQFWTVDLSSYLPDDAEVVFLKFANGYTYHEAIWARAPGSTDAITTINQSEGDLFEDGCWSWECCKVIDGKIELACSQPLYSQVFLFGYLSNKEIVAPTNIAASWFKIPTISSPTITIYPNVIVSGAPSGGTPPASSAWQTINLSSLISAAGITQKVYAVLITTIEGIGTSGTATYGIRPVGSTSDIVRGGSNAVNGLAVCTLNASNQLQVCCTDATNVKFYVRGFIVQDVVKMYSAPVNIIPSSWGPTFTDLSTLPVGAVGGIYTICSKSVTAWGKPYNLNGRGLTLPATENPYPSINRGHGSGGAWGNVDVAYVPVGSNRIVQSAIKQSNQGVYELGYWTSAPVTTGTLFNAVNF